MVNSGRSTDKDIVMAQPGDQETPAVGDTTTTTRQHQSPAEQANAAGHTPRGFARPADMTVPPGAFSQLAQRADHSEDDAEDPIVSVSFGSSHGAGEIAAVSISPGSGACHAISTHPARQAREPSEVEGLPSAAPTWWRNRQNIAPPIADLPTSVAGGTSTLLLSGLNAVALAATRSGGRHHGRRRR